MIHDVFLRRYPNKLYWSHQPTPQLELLLRQAALIFFRDLHGALDFDEAFFKKANDAVAREIGMAVLARQDSYAAACAAFLGENFGIWIESHGDADHFLKTRLSLIEVLFRFAEEEIAARSNRSGRNKSAMDHARTTHSAAVEELNHRFREARAGLHYHNGIIQLSSDELTEKRTAAPCWAILQGSQWSSVDAELKQALDSADNGRADAVLMAARALESTLKIISDVRGWTTGNERGASNYIDNLASQRSGRFIAAWEGDMLKQFFSNVRNPHSHGAGSTPLIPLTPHQIQWSIDMAMAWIKSLIRRL